MKTLLFMMVLAAGTASAYAQGGGANPAAGLKSQAHVLTPAEFDGLIAKPDQILIIDVRRPGEINENGGFPVYLNIQASELERSLAWIPRDRTIVTVSNHAGRGGAAADLLAKNGFKVAGTIGAQTYEQEGGKLLRKFAPAPPQGGAERKGP